MQLPWLDIGQAPRDYADGVPTVSSFRTIDTVLDTVLLGNASRVAGIRVPDLLMSALTIAIAQWTNSKYAAFTLLHYGRQAIADHLPYTLSVGFNVTYVPIVMEVSYAPGGDFVAFARDFSNRVRAIPNEGIGFGLLQYLSPIELRERFEGLPSPEISFNYLPGTDWGLSRSTREPPGWRFARESKGTEGFSGSKSNHIVNVVVRERGEVTTVSLGYSRDIFRPATAEKLASLFNAVLCNEMHDAGFADSKVD